jgi:hypothetical protein
MLTSQAFSDLPREPVNRCELILAVGDLAAGADATVEEIIAVLGHKTPTLALYYSQQARQKIMNENAVEKWNTAIERSAAKKVARERAVFRTVT